MQFSQASSPPRLACRRLGPQCIFDFGASCWYVAAVLPNSKSGLSCSGFKLAVRWNTKLSDRSGLVDRRRVHVCAGDGGHGSVLYTKHTKHKMIGPGWPCGGSGGRGGNVYVKASHSKFTLAHVPGVMQAGHGEPGRKRRINGDSGQDVTIHIPRGVIVRELIPNSEYDKYTNNEHDDVPRFWPGDFIADLDAAGDSLLIATGGSGGRGNTMAVPHAATQGEAGERRHVELELKAIADVGLVGLPNAGKSSLLGAVSRASPKIAPYPFTTVAPYVGKVDYADGTSLTIADVPGLVEGAHLGDGLGHEFLRHLERTKVLLYVIDCARATSPFEDFLCLQHEVASFSQEMAGKPCGVVATKCDLSPHITLARVDSLFHAIHECNAQTGFNAPLFVHAVSARFAEGVSNLLRELHMLLNGRHQRWLERKSLELPTRASVADL